VDSEEVLGLLAEGGMRVSASSRRPDVVIINTCGFLQSARAESLRAIRDAARRRRRGEVGRLVVAGCMVKRYGDELAGISGIDALVGPGRNDRVARAALDAVGNGHGLVRISGVARHEWHSGPRMLSTQPWTAYIKIAEGCDHACSFCTIPSIRGRYTSKPLDRVVAEAAALSSQGVRELNVIAQDTTRYGSDLPGQPDLPVLLREVSRVDGLRWIRVFYAFPDRGLPQLAEAMAGLPKVCAYLDVPFQHSDPAILRAMRRPGSGDEYLGALRRMRATVPDLAVRTTLIVGFPGETDEVFERLVKFVEDAGFDRLGVFEFSPEPGTPAAEMPNQIPAPTRRARRDRLMRMQQQISLERHRAWIGREMDVLVETSGNENGRRQAIGRSFRDGPEVDGSVFVAGTDAPPGSFRRVRVTGADAYDLRGMEIPSATEPRGNTMPMEAEH